jgi:hypothetical protein
MNWLYAKILSAITFIGAIFLLKREKDKHKITAEKLKEKDKLIRQSLKAQENKAEIDTQRRKAAKERAENISKKLKTLGALRNESDNSLVAASLRELYRKKDDS